MYFTNNRCGLNGTRTCKQSSGAMQVCGRLLVAPRDKKARQSYQCTEFSADLHLVFGIDTHNDAVNIHPLKFCYRCKQVMDRSILAQCQHSHYTVSTIPYEWKKHTEQCQVCDITYMSKQVNTCIPIFIFIQICNPRSPQAIHVNHNRPSSKKQPS